MLNLPPAILQNILDCLTTSSLFILPCCLERHSHLSSPHPFTRPSCVAASVPLPSWSTSQFPPCFLDGAFLISEITIFLCSPGPLSLEWHRCWCWTMNIGAVLIHRYCDLSHMLGSHVLCFISVFWLERRFSGILSQTRIVFSPTGAVLKREENLDTTDSWVVIGGQEVPGGSRVWPYCQHPFPPGSCHELIYVFGEWRCQPSLGGDLLRAV